MTWLFTFIQDLSKRCFYGKIEISFEKGVPVNIKEVRNHKPPRD